MKKILKKGGNSTKRQRVEAKPKRRGAAENKLQDLAGNAMSLPCLALVCYSGILASSIGLFEHEQNVRDDFRADQLTDIVEIDVREDAGELRRRLAARAAREGDDLDAGEEAQCDDDADSVAEPDGEHDDLHDCEP